MGLYSLGDNAPLNQGNAFVWQNGVMTDLGTAGKYSNAFGINDRGDISGELGNGPYSDYFPYPVIWQPLRSISLDVASVAQCSFCVMV